MDGFEHFNRNSTMILGKKKPKSGQQQVALEVVTKKDSSIFSKR